MPNTSKLVEIDPVKEKLIEILRQTRYEYRRYIAMKDMEKRMAKTEEEFLAIDDSILGEIPFCAEYLLSKGVTVQERKVGDTIYEADGEHGVVKHDVYEVCVVFKTAATDDNGNEWDDYWTSEDIGTAYKTRNEAESNLPQPPKGE